MFANASGDGDNSVEDVAPMCAGKGTVMWFVDGLDKETKCPQIEDISTPSRRWALDWRHASLTCFEQRLKRL